MDEVARLAAAWHVANVEGDEVEASALLLELSAAIKERDGLQATPMIERLVAVLWPESVLACGNGARAPDASPTMIARPDGCSGPHRQRWGNGVPRRPELSSWPQPITALELAIREYEQLLVMARHRRNFTEA
jgi:hypothetical protein